MRSNEVDIIRMAALIGICVVNVPFMALPEGSFFTTPDNLLDQTAAFIVSCFFELKFFILFSLIFGWGMAIQSKSALAKGLPFKRRYFRRMLGLAIFGVAHAILVFSGDILLLYALFGSLLWKIKDYSPRKLIKVALWMILLSMVLFSLIAFGAAALTDEELSADELGSDGLGGGFIEATKTRFNDWLVTFPSLIFFQGPQTLGAFALGLAAARTDFFSENSNGFKLLERQLPLLLTLAIPLNILYALVMNGTVLETYEMVSFFGFVLITIGAPALSLVYLYLFIRLSRAAELPFILVLAGRNSLSSYIAEGLLAGFFLGSYGFGLFGSLGEAALLPLSIIIALMAMLLVGFYAGKFGRGPLEPILRKITDS